VKAVGSSKTSEKEFKLFFQVFKLELAGLEKEEAKGIYWWNNCKITLHNPEMVGIIFLSTVYRPQRS
jgi:hypothetical protein